MEKRYDGVYFTGGASDCVTGAANALRRDKGGRVIQVGNHAYFISTNARPTDRVRNLGTEYDKKGNVITKKFYPPISVAEALTTGKDITAAVKKFKLNRQ